MDLPQLKNLNVKTPIGVQTRDGVVPLFALRSARGSLGEKPTLTVEAICANKLELHGPCQVFFRGQAIDCRVIKANESDGLWLVTLEAIIEIPEYWREA